MPKKIAKKSSPKDMSLESWTWDAACSIRGAKDAPKYKNFIFTKRFGLGDADIIMSRVLAPEPGMGILKQLGV